MKAYRIFGEPKVSARGIQITIHSPRPDYLPSPIPIVMRGDNRWSEFCDIAERLKNEYLPFFDGHFLFVSVDQYQEFRGPLEQTFSWLKK